MSMKNLIFDNWSGSWVEHPTKPPFRVPIPKFLTIGRVQVPVIGTFDTGVISMRVLSYFDIPIPDGEVWLTYAILYSDFSYVGIYSCLSVFDGTRDSYCYESSRIGGNTYIASLLIPLRGGWSLRFKLSYNAPRSFRVPGFRLDPSVVSVFGGVYNVPANTRSDVYTRPVDDKYRVFMYGHSTGDGANSGCVQIGGLPAGGYEYVSLACSTYYAEWNGARDDWHKIAILNEAEEARNYLAVGLEVVI